MANPTLSPEQRSQLLQIARSAIAAAIAGEPYAVPKYDDPALRRPAGAFVTLTIEGELRGCIGSVFAEAPMDEAVASSARAAAMRDPRFYPLQPAEFPRVALEISVMGPIEQVMSIDQIIPGRDGLIVRSGRHAGLLLPQVATEYGWDRETFLGQTCVKAGLPPDAWQSPDCRIEKFSAEVFGEHST